MARPVSRLPRMAATVAIVAGLPMAPVSAPRPASYPRSYDQFIADARAGRQVRIYANADFAEMLPVVAAFRRRYPGVVVFYTDLGSAELYRRFVTETRAPRPSADLVWSSAMDLKVKLINDGFRAKLCQPRKAGVARNGGMEEHGLWYDRRAGGHRVQQAAGARGPGAAHPRRARYAATPERPRVHRPGDDVRLGAVQCRLPVPVRRHGDDARYALAFPRTMR